MAAAQDNKITELDVAAALTGAEIVPVVQSSETRRTTLSLIKTFVTATLAQVLAVGNKTGGFSITSDNVKSSANVLDTSVSNRFVDGATNGANTINILENKTDHTIKNTFVAPTNDFTGNVKMLAIGNGIHIKTGANATCGTVVLVAGVATVANTLVTATSNIQLTPQIIGTIALPRAVGVTVRVNGTSFTIKSADILDTSTIGWVLIEGTA